MKKKNVKQRLNAMIKELADANYSHIGLVILEDTLQRHIKECQHEVKENLDDYKNSFISPHIFLDVYEIILKNLETGENN
jgi:hypothetical protein